MDPDIPTLEDCCFSYILFHLELFLADYLALLPTRMRRKLLFQLPVADVCRLEETAVVEGVDMNPVWKERSQAMLVPHFSAPSTQVELRRNQGYKQCCNEYVFDMIIRGKTDEAKAMLCHLPIRQCVQTTVYVWSGCACPPRYSSCHNKKTLLAIAIRYFRPPTRLFIYYYVRIPLLLRDPTFVSSIEELGCPDVGFLSTSWTSLESLYLINYELRNSDIRILKSLLPQLKILYIDARIWSLSDFRKMIGTFLSLPTPKKQELRFFHLAELRVSTASTWSFSIPNKVVIIEEDWEVPEWVRTGCRSQFTVKKMVIGGEEVPEWTAGYSLRSRTVSGVAVEDRSLLNEYPFTRLVSRKRKYDVIER